MNTSHSGLEALQAKLHFHLVAQDPEHRVGGEVPELYPPNASIKGLGFESWLVEDKIIAILKPLKVHVVVQPPIKMLPRIALVPGVRTLDSGLANLQQPWMTMV